MAFCDGCGLQVDDAHIRRRIERLELATRFRPIHVQVLLIDAVPPTNENDYFYRAAENREERSVVSRMYFDEIVKSAGIAIAPSVSEDAALAEFQHRGFFLAYAVECPVDSPEALSAALNRLGPVMVKRVNASYKPKYIAPISPAMAELTPLFEFSGWGTRLVLNGGKPFVDPFLGDPQGQAEFGTSLGDRLAEALSSRF
ncbi:MAG TPA: hypothetical protein VN884_10780 [Candidatus Sulfotelmatobacter sp.]|jgi:hypothetical protein|nr:hypothetical protein [Candidatus Sulfotelmatobacter sp.]